MLATATAGAVHKPPEPIMSKTRNHIFLKHYLNFHVASGRTGQLMQLLDNENVQRKLLLEANELNSVTTLFDMSVLMTEHCP